MKNGFFKGIAKGLSKIFGKIKISYEPPEWVKGKRKASAKKAKKVKEEKKKIKIPKLVFVLIPSILIVFFIILIVLVNLPKPKYTYVTVNNPYTEFNPMAIKPPPVELVFSRSAAPLEFVEKVITEGFKIEPEIKGEWEWLSDKTLIFTPFKEWPIGKDFKIIIEWSAVAEHILLEKYDYSFSTSPFRAYIKDDKYYIDPVDPDIKKVVFTVRFNHPVNTEEFEENIRLYAEKEEKEVTNFEYRDYSYSITYNEYYTEAYISSEILPIPDDNVNMRIFIGKNIHADRGSPSLPDDLDFYITVPGLYNYIHINYISTTIVRNERYEMERVIVIDSKGEINHENLIQNIEVYLLPEDRPKLPGIEMKRDYHWSNVEEIGPEILDLSEKLTLDPIPAEREYESLNSFRFKAPQERFLYVKLREGTVFYGDFKLSKDYEVILKLPDFPKELKIMHEGAILSLSGEKMLSIMSHGIEKVIFEIGRIIPDQINHLVSQTSGSFQNPGFDSWRFSEDNIVEKYETTRNLQVLEPGQIQYFSFDFSRYLTTEPGSRVKNGLFYFKVKDANSSLSSWRLILITDLGLLVKRADDGSQDVFVQSVATGLPVAGATVEVIGKNGLSIFTGGTDYNGHVSVPSLEYFEDEKTPTAYVVKKGEDLSFLPYSGYNRWLEYSRFDVGGIYDTASPDKLTAFLFSDRGIYRPGDTFNIGMIVKAMDWDVKFMGVPLVVNIIDSRGLEILSNKFILSQEGFHELSYTLSETAPTGTYQINLSLIKDEEKGYTEFIGNVSIRVEEFLPDRMNITTGFLDTGDEKWISPEGLTAFVNLKNLFGTPASGNRIAAQIVLSPGYLYFYKYKDYQFFDPARDYVYFQESLSDKTTDLSGEARWPLDLSNYQDATFWLRFVATGYEKDSGRSVTSESSVLVSPLPYLIGSKVDGDLSYIYKDSTRIVEFIAIDPCLNRVLLNNVTLKIEEIRYISTLVKLQDETYEYRSIKKNIPFMEEEVTVSEAGYKYTLPTSQPGDFELCLYDEEGRKLTDINYSVIGAGNILISLEQTAELQIKLDKTDYAPGEVITLQIKAPYTGAGLITIERDKVYAYKWFKTTSNTSIQTITVSYDLEVNGYVNVSFIRNMDSEEIYMSPLSYGIVPFSVSREDKINTITLDIPEEIRPGNPFTMKYRASNPGKIVIFAVDEGILQVAKYQTPDPLSHFFKKRALEVSTSQILDLMLPEFSIVQSLSAMGGGMELVEEIGKNLNPFKRKRQEPVVFWSGILDVDQSTREVVYHVPDYFNGTLHVFAVSVTDSSIGVIEKKSLIRDYFVLMPNVPLFTVPGDEFDVSVNVTNLVVGSGDEAKVKLELQTSEHLQVMDESVKELIIPEQFDQTAHFKIKALDILGSGSFSFSVFYNDIVTSNSVDLSVRPPMPYISLYKMGIVKDGEQKVPVGRKMYPHYRQLDITVSYLPLCFADGLYTYLNDYPYGCTEQIVSKSFPLLVLKEREELGMILDEPAITYSDTINILRVRQNSEGAFGFWAANSHVSDYHTVYAMHFLTEARERGYFVPGTLFISGLKYLRMLVKDEKESQDDLMTQTYALYLLTRSGEVTTGYINSIRKSLDDHYSHWEEALPGIFLAASYQMMKMDGEAEEIIKKIIVSVNERKENYYSYYNLTRDAVFLYILSLHFPDEAWYVSDDLLESIVDILSQNYFNTISSSFAILALNTFARQIGEPNMDNVEIKEIISEEEMYSILLSPGLFATSVFSPDALELSIKNKDRNNLYYQITEAGFNLDIPEKPVKEKMEVYREYTDINGNVLHEVPLGDEVYVHIKLRAIEEPVTNIAVVDMLPSGFEVILDSFKEGPGRFNGLSGSTWGCDFVDVREDRLVIFGNIDKDMKEFIYKIRAVNKGLFQVPPIYAEAMYDKNVWALTPSDKISVHD